MANTVKVNNRRILIKVYLIKWHKTKVNICYKLQRVQTIFQKLIWKVLSNSLLIIQEKKATPELLINIQQELWLEMIEDLEWIDNKRDAHWLINNQKMKLCSKSRISTAK